MRVAVGLSVLLHSGVVFTTIMAFPQGFKTPVELPPVLPVELLTMAEETNIAPAVEEDTPAEEPVLEEIPEPDPEPQPLPPEPDPEPQPEPEPEPEPEPAPAAQPEPVVPQPEPEPAPLPDPEPAPEPSKPVVEPLPEPDEPVSDPETVMRARPISKPAARPADPPEEDDFFASTAALLNKKPREEKARDFHQNQGISELSSGDQPRAAAGLQTGLTLSEIDAIRAQLKPCWSPPTGAPNAEELIVLIKVQFNPDGSVVGVPVVVNQWAMSADQYMRTAADRAIRAVLQCQPFELPIDRYRSWQTVELEFDPRFLLGQ